MKKNLSRSQLKADTPHSNSKASAMATSNYNSQQKRQLTDSSLVQIGSDSYSTNKYSQNSANSNSGFKNKGIQQQIQNTVINEENYLQKERQLNQIIKQICNQSSSLKDNNHDFIQNINIPQLTFVSAAKPAISQKKKQNNLAAINSNDQFRKKRALSSEKLSNQNKIPLQNQQQDIISNFEESGKRSSFIRLDSQPQSTDKKNRSKVSTPSSQSYLQGLTPSSQNLNQQRRQSVFDLNQARSKLSSLNGDQQQQYLSSHNHHLSCIMPQKVESKTSSFSQIPNFERGESSSSAKKSAVKNYETTNSAKTSSPGYSKQIQPESDKNSFISKSVDRKLQNGGSSSTTHSQHSNCGGINQYSSLHPIQNSITNSQNILNQYQNGQNMCQQPPILSQTTSYYSNNNKETQQFLMNEQLINNQDKQIEQLKAQLNIANKRIADLEKQNDDLRDNWEQLEKENEQLRRILTEQEQVMCKMKDLYSSISNEESKYRSNHPQENNSNPSSSSATSEKKEERENYNMNEFELNQSKLKNQEYSIRIKVLQENIRELELKNKEQQGDINNFIIQKNQLEQQLLSTHDNFMQQQAIINELNQQLSQIHSNNLAKEEEEEKVKKAKVLEKEYYPNNYLSSTIFNNNSLETYQMIPAIPTNPTTTITNVGNGFESKKLETDNHSLLCKIEDLESQLHQVYKSLNSSPSKSIQNLDFNFQTDNKLLFLAGSQNIPQGYMEPYQLQSGQLLSYEQVKQLSLEVENLKNTIKDQKSQLILWQERYNNLEIVHQALLIEKTTKFMDPIMVNIEENNKDQLKQHIQNLSRQIDEMALLLKDQNTEITFLKMNLQQKNHEIQDLQIKLESKEAASQMIKKRLQDLEEQNITIASQKGQLKVQIKQIQELFDTQKVELNNIYQLLKTRNVDSDNIQNQLDGFQNQSRKQQMTIQAYEKEMDDLVAKNNKLQNQIYDLIHQQAQSNTANYLLNQQKEFNQTLLQSLSSQLQPSQGEGNIISILHQNGFSSPVNYKFNVPLINSSEYPFPQNTNSLPQIRNSFENPTFGNLNTGKNLSTENQLSKENIQQQNQLSFQNQNTNNQIPSNPQLPPLYNNGIPPNNRVTSNISDFELTKSKIDENLITQMSNTNEKSVYMSQ